jgi:hypothetical protein
MAFGYYHLASMLLEIYPAAPRFAIRRVMAGTHDSDVQLPHYKRGNNRADALFAGKGHGACTGAVWCE